jgi:CheY-like chemotaxis protein
MTAGAATVLVVEDNLDIAENLAEILAQEGYACWCAPTADAAVRRLAAEPRPPDAILLDLRMPGMTAVDFVSLLKGRPSWSRIPVVLVTAALEADVPPELEVDEVIFKPFQLPELLEVLNAVVAPSRGV